jgi:hypothetical protein
MKKIDNPNMIRTSIASKFYISIIGKSFHIFIVFLIEKIVS